MRKTVEQYDQIIQEIPTGEIKITKYNNKY